MSDGDQRTPEEIRADLAQTRRELGDTAEALAEKTDVKGRAEERVEEVKANVSARVPDNAQDLVAKVRANPLPLIGAVVVVGAYLLGRRSAMP